MKTRRLFTMGGGGFLEEPQNLLLDGFFIALARKEKPKVCFVPTASGDSKDFIDKFYAAMKNHNVEPSHLSLFKPPAGSLRDFVFGKDVIYVGGGNTRSMLALWREWELDDILREAYKEGVVMGGISAGAICWYEQGLTDSITGELNAWPCLGVLPGSNTPHYDSEKQRRPTFHKLILGGGMRAGIACDDGAAAVFENEKLVEFVSSRPNARAYLVKKAEAKIVESLMQPRYLGSPLKAEIKD